MKISLLALVLLAAAGVAAPASAFTPGPPFQLTGTFVIVSPSITCTTTLNVVGGPGGATSITSVVFAGSPVCATLSASSLPWALTPISTTAVKISPVVVRSPFLTCSAPSVTGAWSNTAPGVATFTSVSAPPCIVSMSLSASPPQTLP